LQLSIRGQQLIDDLLSDKPVAVDRFYPMACQMVSEGDRQLMRSAAIETKTLLFIQNM